MFDNTAADLETVRFTIRVIMGVSFFDGLAFFTDEKFGEMPFMAVIAGDKGVECFNAVDQPVF